MQHIRQLLQFIWEQWVKRFALDKRLQREHRIDLEFDNERESHDRNRQPGQ